MKLGSHTVYIVEQSYSSKQNDSSRDFLQLFEFPIDFHEAVANPALNKAMQDWVVSKSICGISGCCDKTNAMNVLEWLRNKRPPKDYGKDGILYTIFRLIEVKVKVSHKILKV